MKERLLIVEDEFIVANDLSLMLERAGYHICGIASSVEEARAVIRENKVDLVLLDIHLKGKLTGIDLAIELRNEHIAFVYLSANSNQQILEAAKATEPYGFLVKPYREKDVLVTLDIARYRHTHSRESKMRQESLLETALKNIISDPVEWQGKLLKTANALQSYIPFDYLAVCMRATEEPFINGCSFLRIGFNEYQVLAAKELAVVTGKPPEKLYEILLNAPAQRVVTLYNDKDFEDNCNLNVLKNMYANTFQLHSELAFPLFMPGGNVFTFSFFSRQPAIYNAEHLVILLRLQYTLSAIAAFVPVVEKKALYKEAIVDGKQEFAQQQVANPAFKDVVGNSSSLLYVLDLVTQVAPLDTTVLILGESGTGKEGIADCIHNLSARKDKPFVKINCAALPHSLIESELFGHEKGAFTGAIDKKIGKFELGSGGTIFLDEIGELPLAQQVKLLRVLQEREIERIGGKQPVKVDVRIIAATNRNLEKEVGEGRFRLDLFYRLNVFQIMLPALRDRKEDIEQLATYFAKQFFGKMNKQFHGISLKMLEELKEYNWPGNIRELENIIEQSAILNDGTSAMVLKRKLENVGGANSMTRSNDADKDIKTLTDIKQSQQESERAYIISILKKTSGRIRGNGGAAELLNQKPTTLESRIAKLGIKREDILM